MSKKQPGKGGSRRPAKDFAANNASWINSRRAEQGTAEAPPQELIPPFVFAAHDYDTRWLLLPFLHAAGMEGFFCTRCLYCAKESSHVMGMDDLECCRHLKADGWGLLALRPLLFHAVCPACLIDPRCRWGDDLVSEACRPAPRSGFADT